MSSFEDFGVLTEAICARWGRANTRIAWLEITDILHGAMMVLPFPASEDAYVLATLALERRQS